MTIVRRLLEARSGLENPAVPISAADVWQRLGFESVTDAGESVSVESALGIPAVLRGAQIIASTAAGLPLKVRASADDERVDPPWMGTSDITGMTHFECMETTFLHEVLWGDAFWFKVRDSRQVVVDKVPVHPARIRVDVVPWGREKIKFEKVFVLDGTIPLTAYEILHFPGPSTDGVRGISEVAKVRQSLGIAIAAERTAARIYGQGLMLSGIIEAAGDLTKEQADKLKANWAAKYGGGSYTVGDVAVLDNGAKFRELTMPPGDAEFLASRQFSVTEIARWLGLPSWMLNDQEKSTSWGTGMEQQFTTFVQLTMLPKLRRVESRITAELASTAGAYAEFAVEGLLRGDSAARAAFYASGITNGWLVPNEPRAMENLPPVEWGDKPYRPYNEPASGAKPTTASALPGGSS